MKTHTVAEQALTMMIEDYNAGLHPTTYGDLARRCGFEGQQNARWFGQVTDLIDAACALAGVPSFALVRVREANGNINNAAWRNEYSHLRDRIIEIATAGAVSTMANNNNTKSSGRTIGSGLRSLMGGGSTGVISTQRATSGEVSISTQRSTHGVLAWRSTSSVVCALSGGTASSSDAINVESCPLGCSACC
jgi:hypothetical protein